MLNTYNFDAREDAIFTIEDLDSSFTVESISIKIYLIGSLSQVVYSNSYLSTYSILIPANTLVNGEKYLIRTSVNSLDWGDFVRFECSEKGVPVIVCKDVVDTAFFNVGMEWSQVKNILPKKVKYTLKDLTEIIEESPYLSLKSALPNKGGKIIVGTPIEGVYAITVKRSGYLDVSFDLEVGSIDTPEEIAYNLINLIKINTNLYGTLSGASIQLSTKEPIIETEILTPPFIEAEILTYFYPEWTFEKDNLVSPSIELEVIDQLDISSITDKTISFSPYSEIIDISIDITKNSILGENLLEMRINNLSFPYSEIDTIILKRREIEAIEGNYKDKENQQLAKTEIVQNSYMKRLLEKESIQELLHLSLKKDEEKYGEWFTVGQIGNPVEIVGDFLTDSCYALADKVIDSGALYEYRILFKLKNGVILGASIISILNRSSNYLSLLQDLNIKRESIIKTLNGERIIVSRNDFEDDFITDGVLDFRIKFDRELSSIDYNRSGIEMGLLNSDKPVVSYTEKDYRSGNISFTLLSNETFENYELYRRKQMVAKDMLLDFLGNKKEKLIRLKDGETLLIQVVGSPKISVMNNLSSYLRVTFNFVEVSNLTDEVFLRRGFIDEI